MTVFHELRNGLMKDPAKVYGRGTGNGVGKGPELEVTNSARSEETKMLKTAGSHRASCSPFLQPQGLLGLMGSCRRVLSHAT